MGRIDVAVSAPDVSVLAGVQGSGRIEKRHWLAELAFDKGRKVLLGCARTGCRTVAAAEQL